MTILNKNYRLETDSATGLAQIEMTGRCTSDEAAEIERNCTRRFRLETLPQAAGAVLKALDGTSPAIVDVAPPTTGRTYRCVKVDGRCNPLAAAQVGGPHNGKTILSFRVRYQEVGGVE